MIKVEYTKTITTYEDGIVKTTALVADTELILIPDKNGEYISCLQANIPNEKGYRGFCKPILISKTEKIEENDYGWDVYENKIFQAITYKGVKWSGITKNRYFKIIALPEHFSPETLKDIVDGKLKEGKCMVECEEQYFHGAGYYSKEELSKEQQEKYSLLKINVIELNPHITIYPVEEKMYSKEEIASWVDELHHLSYNGILNGRSYSSGVLEAASLIFNKLI